MSQVYDSPLYYEIAFGFRDIAGEADVFEECIRRYSRIPVESILELACGTCPHMIELVRRGYRYIGLDLSRPMLDYSRAKATAAGVAANLVRGDMVDFSLDVDVDFAYILLGSLIVKDSEQLRSHFDSVARVLKKGGLYLLDWCVQFETPFEVEGGESWEMEREGIKVKTTVSWKAIDRVEQIFEEKIRLDVDDHGKALTIEGCDTKRAIYPQEFLLLVAAHEHFEFVGWWNNWDLNQPLTQATKIDRPIALLRRV